MKKTAALAALIVLCSCREEYTGLGSVDLEVTSMTFRDSDPATITAELPAGKPADFITAAESPLIESMKVQTADTSGMAEANSTVSFPVFYGLGEANPDGTSARFEIRHLGLSWAPEYSVSDQAGENRVYATARLENMTVQTWQTDTISFRGPDGESVTTATGRITVRQGTSIIPWWDAPAGSPGYELRYGWPVPGRWNALTRVSCPGAGRVESWNGGARKAGDFIYFPAESLVLLSLDWEQGSDGYRCFLTVESTSEATIQWDIVWPDRLPRGATIEPGPDSISLFPGESATILYEEVY